MSNVRTTTVEEGANANTIASIANETDQPFHVVKQIYEEQYGRLRFKARLRRLRCAVRNTAHNGNTGEAGKNRQQRRCRCDGLVAGHFEP